MQFKHMLSAAECGTTLGVVAFVYCVPGAPVEEDVVAGVIANQQDVSC
jgi:hypothetical protein